MTEVKRLSGYINKMGDKVLLSTIIEQGLIKEEVDVLIEAIVNLVGVSGYRNYDVEIKLSNGE